MFSLLPFALLPFQFQGVYCSCLTRFVKENMHEDWAASTIKPKQLRKQTLSRGQSIHGGLGFPSFSIFNGAVWINPKLWICALLLENLWQSQLQTLLLMIKFLIYWVFLSLLNTWRSISCSHKIQALAKNHFIIQYLLTFYLSKARLLHYRTIPVSSIRFCKPF